jgi:hypothetical protein
MAVFVAVQEVVAAILPSADESDVFHDEGDKKPGP